MVPAAFRHRRGNLARVAPGGTPGEAAFQPVVRDAAAYSRGTPAGSYRSGGLETSQVPILWASS